MIKPIHTRLSERQRNDDDNNMSPTDDSSSFPSLITENPARSLSFSAIMAICGAALGPFLDSYHSAFGVLQYNEPITATLWGTSADNPALITAWWVPVLFGVAGWLIGWLYIVLDAVLQTTPSQKSKTDPSPPKILVGISLFTLQYWLSGIFVAAGVLDRTGILNFMSLYAAIGFVVLDGTLAGFITSAATALGGPLIEVGLLSMSRAGIMPGGYHYNDLGETGFFPLWIIPVYFLGGPAVGNLARGFWNALGSNDNVKVTSRDNTAGTAATTTIEKPGCKQCNDTRCVPCPNCDGVGDYVTYGKSVKCTSCSGRGFVICRSCFASYNEDPNDIEAIRDLVSRMPD
ncbi:Insulin-induced protein (INSIG) [Seminavis robusta]|uniref:Insulin-induced protein (INSIG) n=1 Tax=Seminavis robusta TaxID=568900 RepID=A0A9N8HB98_9STRA|nr:Insulin-induced protein (INSIG) [Seminavis robusta]|eukprot:Sro253_g099880.1 Insulin-induced protein (INSIG) (346) ;mRNA; r:39911-41040